MNVRMNFNRSLQLSSNHIVMDSYSSNMTLMVGRTMVCDKFVESIKIRASAKNNQSRSLKISARDTMQLVFSRCFDSSGSLLKQHAYAYLNLDL
jgi:hypothetical protein